MRGGLRRGSCYLGVPLPTSPCKQLGAAYSSWPACRVHHFEMSLPPIGLKSRRHCLCFWQSTLHDTVTQLKTIGEHPFQLMPWLARVWSCNKPQKRTTWASATTWFNRCWISEKILEIVKNSVKMRASHNGGFVVPRTSCSDGIPWHKANAEASTQAKEETRCWERHMNMS